MRLTDTELSRISARCDALKSLDGVCLPLTLPEVEAVVNEIQARRQAEQRETVTDLTPASGHPSPVGEGTGVRFTNEDEW